MKLRINTRWL